MENSNKLKVFIDFEAITNNFLKRLPINLNIRFLPYCYTIGVYRNNDVKNGFITKTSLMSFKNFELRTYRKKLKVNLLNDISILAKEKITEENLHDKVEFYGWNPQMENLILNNLFGIECFNASKHNGKQMLSLKIVVPHMHKDNYFQETKKIFAAKQPEVEQNIFNDPGYAASYLGYMRFIAFSKLNKKKYKINLTLDDIALIDTDIMNYNKDDVIKLDYCYRNQDIILKRSKKLTSIDANINRSANNLSQQKRLLKNFEKYAEKYNKKSVVGTNDKQVIADLEEYATKKIVECNWLLKFIKELPDNIASIEEAIMWAEFKIEATNDKIKVFKKERNEL
ncbi:hypothetical protein [Mycoplasma sp. VS31B]